VATQFIERFSSLSFIRSLPTAAGIGAVGGQLFANINGGPVPIGGMGGSLRGVRVVDPVLALTVNDIHATIQAAVDAADEAEDILIAPAEYDENVLIETPRLRLFGIGAQHAIRVTGTLAGTATAIHVSGVSEIGLYNLNLEGRTGGSGLKLSGQIRRMEVGSCKLHGGDQAVLLASAGGGQIVDIRILANIIANSAIGLSMAYSGGDPGHQFLIASNLFQKIVTDCIVENGATHDWSILDNTFALNDGTEPTRFLDIDTVGTTGLAAGNRFATTVFAAAKMAIAAGVLWVDNKVEAELPGLAAYGTGGRPD
jgi:hypothetical protein